MNWKCNKDEPKDRAHCLLWYSDKLCYLDFETAFYDKKSNCFVTGPYPHRTGTQIAVKTFDGILKIDQYRSERDKIQLKDIYKWIDLNDIV